MRVKHLLESIKSWKDDELAVKIKTNGKAIDIDKVIMSKNGNELWLIPAMFNDDEEDEESPYDGIEDLDL